jgi:hypothetical protein
VNGANGRSRASTAGPLVVVGDALLDCDVDGRVARLCPDAPVPVLEDAVPAWRPGGAALAALLAAAADTPVVLVAPLAAAPCCGPTGAAVPPGPRPARPVPGRPRRSTPPGPSWWPTTAAVPPPTTGSGPPRSPCRARPAARRSPSGIRWRCPAGPGRGRDRRCHRRLLRPAARRARQPAAGGPLAGRLPHRLPQLGRLGAPSQGRRPTAEPPGRPRRRAVRPGLRGRGGRLRRGHAVRGPGPGPARRLGQGGDYHGRELPEAALLEHWGGVAVTVPYLSGRSTTRLADGLLRAEGA